MGGTVINIEKTEKRNARELGENNQQRHNINKMEGEKEIDRYID